MTSKIILRTKRDEVAAPQQLSPLDRTALSWINRELHQARIFDKDTEQYLQGYLEPETLSQLRSDWEDYVARLRQGAA